MKFKNILALAVACGAALVMSVAAHAATEVKVEGATTDEYGAVVPIVLNTTDIDKLSQVSCYEIVLNYDNSVWKYDSYNDPNTYGTRNPQPMGDITTNPAVNNDGTVELVFTCSGANGFPTVTDGKLTLIEVYLAPVDSTIPSVTDTDFSIGVNYVADYDQGNNTAYFGTDMNSFFTFDVTGDLDGNEIVALAASTDGGVTKQPLEKYVSTDWTEGTEYASATTKFLVAVKNEQGIDSTANIIIYGEKADGTYVPLTAYDQSDFAVQTFKNTWNIG